MNIPQNNLQPGTWMKEDWQVYKDINESRYQFVSIQSLDSNFADTFFSHLHRDAAFELTANGVFDIDESLKHLYFKARIQEKANGVQSFAFAYPICRKADAGEETIAAPLFLWQLNIEASSKHNAGWKISRQPLHKIYANQLLLDYWKEYYQLDIEEDIEQLLNGPFITKNKLEGLIQRIKQAFSDNDEATIEEETVDGTGKPSFEIDTNGVFGVFNGLDAYAAEANIKEDDTATPNTFHYTNLPLSPEQATAYQMLLDHQSVWLGGPGGSGKTHLGLHSVLSTLLNDKKVLVVSRSMGTLRQYQERLEQLGLEKLSYLLRDTPQDKALFIELLKASVATKSPDRKYDAKAYRFLTEKLERLRQKLERNYHSSRKHLFEGHNWADMVGLYLSSTRKEGKELLATQVNASDYDFSEEEFEALSESIATCVELFEQTHTLKSSLNNLSPGIYLRMEKEEAEGFVSNKVDSLIEKGKRLQYWYINRIDAYASLLTAHYEQYYQKYTGILVGLKDKLADTFSRYGTEIGHSTLRKLKLQAIFSSEAKEKIAALQSIVDDYDSLREDFAQASYFDFNFPLEKGGLKLSDVQEGLEAFEIALQNWRLRQRELVQEETMRLSSKTAHPRLNFEDQLIEMVDGLNAYFDQINESGLYHLPFHNKTLTIPKQQRLLEEVIEQLEETQRAMPEFENFYGWQNNWLQLDEKSRRLIRILIKVQPNDWLAAFESWFYDNLLSKHYEAILPPSLEDTLALGSTYDELKPLLTPHLLLNWHKEKETAFKKLKRQNKSAYQQIMSGSLQSDKTFRQIFEKSGQAITAAMPIFMLNPELAIQLFASVKERFGLILVDEAHLLSDREAAFLHSIGEKVLLLGYGDEAAPPPAQVVAERQGGVSCFLNEIVEGPALNLLYAIQQYQKGVSLPFPPDMVAFEQIDGRYDEDTEVNEEEALRVISMLNEIKRTPQRTFPSVGIVCFTYGQRDLISSYLLGIKQRRSTGVETIQQLERNGMMVLQLEELSGQRFDILIVSSTYGAIDLDGNMTGHIHRMSRDRASASLHLLMSRASQQLYFLNSIADEVLEESSRENPAAASFLMSAYIKYLRGISHQNVEEAFAAIEQLLNYPSRHTDIQDSADTTFFLEEVRMRLLPYLGKGTLRAATATDGVEGALLIAPGPTGETEVAILPDGFLARSPNTDYRWECEQLKALQQKDISALAATSANWWRNPDQEARKAASRVIQGQRTVVKEEEE